jgi:pimeloyl-ACP methyl ester carboxylesterase
MAGSEIDVPARPVTFANESGLKLFGILHEPPIRRRACGLILLSPGIKSRVAPHRMYNKIANLAVQLGFPVLRFDFSGLGDSEGTLNDRVLPDLYGAIQVGRCVGDTRQAIDWMRANCGVDRVILGGLCGGAITGVLAAAGHPHVSGLFGIGLPVMVEGSQVDATENMTVGQLQGIRSKYVKKLFSPSAWARVFTMRTDFRLLRKSLLAGAQPSSKRTPGPSDRTGGQAPKGNANPHFPKAFERVLEQGCPNLLLFSEMDRLYAEFQEKFLAIHGGMVQANARLIDIHVVQEANHVLTFSEWQHTMLDHLQEWLQRWDFGVEADAADRQARRMSPA